MLATKTVKSKRSSPGLTISNDSCGGQHLMTKTEAIAFDINTMKNRMLLYEAKRWVSFTESGGNNRGQVVEAFQKAVDGKAQGEPWCMSFVQYCLKHVDSAMEEVLNKKTGHHVVEKSEHCLTCWFKSPREAQHKILKPGRIVIWRHGSTTNGHTGIVVQIEDDGQHVWTVEGNTGDSDSTVQRQGDGVYLKRRSIKGQGKMKVVGYLQPWL